MLFLGDYITKYKDKITFNSKDTYVDNMLTMLTMEGCKPTDTPMVRKESAANSDDEMLEEPEAETYQWEEIRPVFARRPNIVRKNQDTLPPRLLSQPYHDRGREVSAAKVTMCPFFDNRADIIFEVLAREHLMNIGNRPRTLKNETGCKAGDKCLFPRYKVEEQPNKKSQRATSKKKDKSAVAVVKSLSQLGCVSQDSDALVSHCRKPRGNRRTRSWNQFKEYDSLSLRYVMRVPGKERTIVGEKTCQSSSSAKSLRYEIPPLLGRIEQHESSVTRQVHGCDKRCKGD